MTPNPKPGPVLLVDDEPGLLVGLSLILQSAGFEVLPAPDAETARTMAESRPDISLAVLDVGLPDASGYDLCQDVRVSSDTPDLPVLFISSRRGMEEVLKGMAAGARDFLAKPFGPREFLSAVERVLAA